MKCLCDKCKHNDGCPAKEEHGGALRCSAYKPQEQTNEEYIHSLNTEQLAKVLLSFCQYPCEICKIECNDGNACTYNKALNTIMEWLKQPHGGES